MPIANVEGPDAVATVLSLLAQRQSPDDTALMRWSPLSLVFLDDTRQVRAKVDYIEGGYLAWDGWRGDRPLAQPARVIEWLAEQGWSG